MPQCAKCGREISDYGLCRRCESAKATIQAKVKPVCPICKSKYNEAIGIGKYRCCNCDAVFLNSDISKE